MLTRYKRESEGDLSFSHFLVDRKQLGILEQYCLRKIVTKEVEFRYKTISNWSLIKLHCS